MIATKLSSHCLMMWFFLVPKAAAAADDPLSHSLHWAILFLLAMPYTIGGSIAAWIVYSHWRGDKRRNRLRKRGSFLPRTTQRRARERATARTELPAREVAQSDGLIPVVRGLRLIETPKEGGR